ncbi:MAG: urea carboxylase, partial [Pseudohongiellaceae bacterium]
SGNVWKIEVQEGDVINKGQTLMVLESMKMEIAIQAQFSGTIAKLWARTGQDVQAGQCLMWLEQETDTQ